MSTALLALLLQMSIFAPPSAVDHVVHLEKLDQNGVPDGRTVLYRSGPHIRTEWIASLRGEINYTDLASGLVVSALRNGEGVVQRVTIGRSFDRPRRLPPTGRQGGALGESCTIFRLLQERRGTGSEICETADGILLWQTFWYPRSNDRTHMYMRATALEPAAAPAADAAQADYEVELVAADPADGSYVLRRHGRFSSNARRNGGERSLRVSNGTVSVSYSEDEAGRPLSLEIVRAGYDRLERRGARWERVPERATEQLLGETCTWQENVAIQSNDRHYECRIADGISLKTESWFHWTGGPWRFTARSLSRRPLSDEDFALPVRALDWAHWGITPAP